MNNQKIIIGLTVTIAGSALLYGSVFKNDGVKLLFAQQAPLTEFGGLDFDQFFDQNSNFPQTPTGGLDFDTAFDQPASRQERQRADRAALEREGQAVEQLQRQDEQQCKDEAGLGGIPGGGTPGGPMNVMNSLGDFAGLEGANQTANQAVSQAAENAARGNNNPGEIMTALDRVATSQGANSGNRGIIQQIGQIAQNSVDGGRLDITGTADVFGSLTGLGGDTLNDMAEILEGADRGEFRTGPTSEFFGNLLGLEDNQIGQLGDVLASIDRGESVVGDAVDLVGSFTDLDSGTLNQFGNLLDQITSGGDVNIGDLSNFTGDVLNLSSSNQSLLSGAGNLIQSAVDGNFDIVGATDFVGNLTGLEGNSLNILGDAGSLIQGAIDGNFDIAGATDFVGQLGGLEGDSLSLLGDAGGLIQSAVDGNFDIVGATNFVGNLGGLSDSALSTLGGAGSLIQGAIDGNFDLAAAGDFLGGLTDLGGGSLDALLGNSGALSAIQDAFNGNISFAGATEIISAIPGVGNIPLVGDLLGGGPLAIVGLGSVPVRETSGPLLSTTQNNERNTASIDKTTKSIEELLVEICTYEKSIQRIQAAWEQRQLVEEPDLRRQANSAMEQYRQDVADLTQRGYRYGDDEEGPLFVENTRQHINTIILPEIMEVYYDQLENSEDSFKDETSNALKQTFNQRDIPQSTVSKDQYNKFVNDQITDSNEWWDTLLAINDPSKPNKPETSYLLNNQALGRRLAQAEQDFLQELVAGQGYLPVRECVEYTSDGQTCVKWEVVTPAIQIKETNADVFSYRQDLYTEPELGDVAPGNEPNLEEVRTFTPSTSGGGGGSQGIGTDIGGLLQMLNSLRQGQNNSRPELSFSLGIPPMSLLQQGSSNVARLRWQSKGVSECTPGNNWLSRGSMPENLDTARRPGDSLGANNYANIPLPLTFGVRLDRDRGDELNYLPQRVSSSINETATHQETVIAMPESIVPGDIFIISFWPHNINSKVSIAIGQGGADKAGMVGTFRQAINTARSENNTNQNQRAEFNKYSFSYDEQAGTIKVTPRLTYEIRCTTNDDEILSEQITITR